LKVLKLIQRLWHYYKKFKSLCITISLQGPFTWHSILFQWICGFRRFEGISMFRNVWSRLIIDAV